MLKSGILNPAINDLISRLRHTNTIVIADRGFPFWPTVETIDLSLVDDIPRVLDVLAPILERCIVGRIYMAREFPEQNAADVRAAFHKVIGEIPVTYESHVDLKKRVPGAIGLIRTGDTIQYANMILESA